MTRRAVLGTGLTLAACRKNGLARGDDDGTLERYALQGQVIRIDRESAIVTLKHRPITKANGELWMEAMTMDFPVARREELSGLKRGQAIQATVVVRNSDFDYWIERIQPNAEH